MSDISKINVEGVDYDLKDSQGRELLNEKVTNISLNIQGGGYQKLVIGLCDTAKSDVTLNSYSEGMMFSNRVNGLRTALVSLIGISSKYVGDNAINASVLSVLPTSYSILKPCIFTYNGQTYGGVEFYMGDATYDTLNFIGASNFDIFAVPYWDTRNNVALNEEIANSLKYDTVTYANNFYYNEVPVMLPSVTTSDNGKILKVVNGVWTAVAE